MIKIFSSKIYTYQISKPKQEIISKFQEMFKPSIGLFSSSDFVGSCGNDSFELKLVPLAYTRGPKIRSTLIGTVFEINASQSKIEIEINRSPGVFTIILFFFVFSLIMFIQFLNKERSFGFLLWSLAGLILVPAFVLWFSNVSSNTMKERFETLLNRQFIAS